MEASGRPTGPTGRIFTLFLGWAALAVPVQADPFPPVWTAPEDCGAAGSPCHFPPAAWPDEPAEPADCGATCGGWTPYTRFQDGVRDPRVQDPSNGGTRPQNYVNIASSCSDRAEPSVYYSLVQG